jgi:S-disulfanyl-L-cysteine oxidoreductase SoxD
VCDRRAAALALPAALALLAGAGCDNSWRTDMWYQPSRRPEDLPRPEPEHSVPLGAAPRFENRDDTEDLKNPVPPTERSLTRGKAIFVARCAPCHGPEGRGGGPVSQFFPEAPDFAYTTIRKRSDGFIWGTISYGGKAMPPQREGLTVEERWDVVNHVRAIQASSPVIQAPAQPAATP